MEEMEVVGAFSRIEEYLDSLSERQTKYRRIAVYFLSHREDAVFATAEQIGVGSGVSSSSVVRFSQSLGYAGFPQLQRELRNDYTEGKSVPEFTFKDADELKQKWIELYQQLMQMQEKMETLRQENNELGKAAEEHMATILALEDYIKYLEEDSHKSLLAEDDKTELKTAYDFRRNQARYVEGPEDFMA